MNQPSRIRARRVTVACCAALLISSGAPAFAAELVLDFRGGKVDRKLYRFDSKEAFESITPEPDGLRLQYIPGKTPNKTLGIAWNFQVRGDFVVTAHYEILAIEKPAKGSGVGVELYLMLDDPSKKENERDGIPLSRLLRPSGTAAITIQHRVTNEEGKRINKVSTGKAATAASERGRLRLARQGATMIASFAEGDAEEFQELNRFEV